MALQKEIKMNNGIVLNYHRINTISLMTNWCISINISSYISKEEREKEQEYQAVQRKSVNGETLSTAEVILLNKPLEVYIEGDFIEIDYDENLSIKDIYEYLKTTDKYKDAVDV